MPTLCWVRALGVEAHIMKNGHITKQHLLMTAYRLRARLHEDGVWRVTPHTRGRVRSLKKRQKRRQRLHLRPKTVAHSASCRRARDRSRTDLR